MAIPHKSLNTLTLLIPLAVAGSAHAGAIGHALQQQMAAAAAGERLEIIVTLQGSSAPSNHVAALLQGLGIHTAVTLRALPMLGTRATTAQIHALAARPEIRAIHYNSPLQFTNLEARKITGAARVVENPADFGRAIPYSGAGVTVMVHDSGIDATHADLQYGSHVVQNVQALTNLQSLESSLPFTYLENQLNTDLSSGHGTHVAGTMGATGARSGGKFRGVAPGAHLVGYGSGAAVAILYSLGGFDYALTHQFSYPHPIRVITNSWGGSGPFDPTDPVNVASYEAYKRGMVVLFAAGNDGPAEDTHNPYAQAPWVISVAASEKDGVLTDFSSRGKRGERGSFQMADGRHWTYVNEPTITAPGVDIISTRALSGALPYAATPDDAAVLTPAELPFYTVMSGTSMATPHVAGVVALMLEANPALGPDDVREILRRTATNISGRLSWEAGTGHVNAYAAVQEAAAVRGDYGATVNAGRSFNSSAILLPGPAPLDFSLQFLPVGTVQEVSFQVSADIAWVAARAEIGENTLALLLTDPAGNKYGSGVSLPLLGSTVSAGAPGRPGTWKLTVRGVGSVSGVGLDPLGVSNGVGLPGTVTGQISFLRSGGYTGLNDIAGHAVRGAIEHAISQRLADGYSDGNFRPDQVLTRAELADFLTMGGSIRQQLPRPGDAAATDVGFRDPHFAAIAAVTTAGGVLRDLSHRQAPVLPLRAGAFLPTAAVTRLDLAGALVQALGLEANALGFSGPLTVQYEGRRLAIEDAASVPANQRGYVQLALDQGLLGARFWLTQGPLDPQPVVHAKFDPATPVTRAAYVVAIGRWLEQYLLATDA